LLAFEALGVIDTADVLHGDVCLGKVVASRLVDTILDSRRAGMLHLELECGDVGEEAITDQELV